MDKTSIATLAIGLLVVMAIGGVVFTSVLNHLEQDQRWCQNHGGELGAHNEIIYCDLPEKDVLLSDVREYNYPSNASVVPSANVDQYEQPLFRIDHITVSLALAVFGVGLTFIYSESRFGD